MDAQEGLQDVEGEPPDIEGVRDRSFRTLFPIHKKAANVNEALAEFQLATLMELGRRALVDEGLRRLPPPVAVPAEMVREAWRQGARGKELALWVAAASATLAVGLRFGPVVQQAIPRLIRPTGGGGIGFRFQAPTFKELVKKRVSGFLSSAGHGGDFAGLLG